MNEEKRVSQHKYKLIVTYIIVTLKEIICHELFFKYIFIFMYIAIFKLIVLNLICISLYDSFVIYEHKYIYYLRLNVYRIK